MKIEVIGDRRNDLLRRRELDVEIQECAVTPARKDVTSALAAKLGVPDGTVAIERVTQDYGSRAARCSARVYETAELMRKYERPYLSERGKPREAKAKEEKAAEKAAAKEEKKEAK